MLTPLRLASHDTPIEHLTRASLRLGVDVWIKRDDLTGLGLSGNKVRKLEYLLADAVARGARSVVTCGGMQSNHCRATAVACRRLGLHPILVLRGSPPPEADGNLLLDRILGAEIRWVTPAEYAERAAILADYAALGAYAIPEGGSNALGAFGYVRAAKEAAGQLLARGVTVDTVVCAVGSGGTLAGLAMAGWYARILGVAVCDDRAFFRARVEEIGEEAGVLYGLRPGGRWDVVEGYQGRGYGLSTPEELREIAQVAREEGVLLDPVYTGKAWFALAEMARSEPGSLGRRVLFWHTGGVFGLFGRGAEIEAALR